MILRSKKPGTPPLADRRSGQDRRKVDKGPPSGRERRVHLEPRRPEVSELDLSNSEWAALQEQAEPVKKRR
jgi:hypothetical protein